MSFTKISEDKSVDDEFDNDEFSVDGKVEMLRNFFRQGNKILVRQILSSRSIIKTSSDRTFWQPFSFQDSRTEIRLTALHEACRQGWLDIVKDLIKNFNCSPNMRNSIDRQSPLHICCQNGHLGIVKYLINHGCDPFLRDKKGKEAIDYALKNDYIKIVQYLCNNCITSQRLIENSKTTVSVFKTILDHGHLHWKTADGESILNTVCHSKSKLIIKCITSCRLQVLTMIRDYEVHARYGEECTIPHIICQDQSCVSCISSVIMKEWLRDNKLDPLKLVTCCNWKTADGDTLLQLVCQSESCVARLSSDLMLNWLADTTCNLSEKDLMPNYKTADDNTLLRLICQSQSCLSLVSAKTLKTWLESTVIDLYIDNLNWKTSDNVAMIKVIHNLKSQPITKHFCGILLGVMIITNWKNVELDSSTSFRILYIHDSNLLQTSGSDTFQQWLQKTARNPERIASSQLETAHGYNLLQLVLQSESFVSHLHSTILLQWMTDTPPNEKCIKPNLKTADNKFVFELVFRSKLCVSHVSSTMMLKWLGDATLDQMECIIPTYSYETADGDTLLQLIFQSESCISHVPSTILLKWMTDTLIDEKHINPKFKTADKKYVFELVFQSKLFVSHVSSTMILKWLADTTLDPMEYIIPTYETADGDNLYQLIFQSESCISRLPSTILLQWMTDKLIDEKHIKPNLKTGDKKYVFELVFQSKLFVSHVSSTMILKWLADTTLDQMEYIVPTYKTADGDTLLQLIFQSESCISRVPSIMLLKWMTDTQIDEKHINPKFKTADEKYVFELVCQSKLYVSRLSSTVISKWLIDTTPELMNLNCKTADGDTLLQVLFQSQLCVSRVSSQKLKDSFTSIEADILIPSVNWMTADGLSMATLIERFFNPQQLKFDLEQLVSDHQTKVVITLHWKSDDGSKIHVLYWSESYISQLSSAHLLKWLQKTNIDVSEIIIPHWKTADGDTLLQLVCQSESCVARICSTVSPSDSLLDLVFQSEYLVSQTSSQVIIQWLNGNEFVLAGSTVSSWITKSGNSIFQLFCTSRSCLSHISSSLMLKWINESDVNEANFNILKSVHLEMTTADGDSMLYLLCKSSLKENKIVELLEYNLLQGILNLNVKYGNGNMALHLACEANKLDTFKFLLTKAERHINVRNHNGLSPLEMSNNPEIILYFCQYDSVEISSKAVRGWLDNSAFIDTRDMIKIFEQIIHKHELETFDGNTLLHLCCGSVDDNFRDTNSLVTYLLNQHQNPNSLDKNGKTPLQLTNDVQIMNNLVKHGGKVTSDVMFKIISHVEERKAREILLISSTKETFLWKPTDLSNDGDTALHLACRVDKPLIVKYLLKYGNCNPSDKNLRAELPIELTTNIDSIRILIEHGSKVLPELILKFSALEKLRNEEFALLIGNPDFTNSDGNTALHLACQLDQPEIVNFLLSQAHCDPNVKNNNNEVPLQMTTNSDIIKDLIRYGAQTSMMYKSHKSSLGTNEPIKPPVKIFVVGNPSVGKSTLTEAIKKKLNFVARWFTPGKVSGVEKKTVGIIPHEIESEIFGRVTIYDFAGHREFYSGHAALLKAAIQLIPPIFLLLVNLLDEEEKIIQNILYWISFLENQCTLVSCKPHLIIVGSHADTLKSKGVNPDNKVDNLNRSLLNANYFINLELIEFIPMDCQLHESAGMNHLRPLLVKSCGQLRIQEPITFNAHCFLVYLIDTFKSTPAVTISSIHEQIETQLSSDREGVLDFLPTSVAALYKICTELNERGHILFLRDKKMLENSYVVIEEKSLLSEVSGTVFASEDFKQYKQLSTNTGVVSLSKIAECFPSKDVNILIGFLTHLEFCHEISDQILYQLISEKYSQVADERYYLFPGLISIKAEESIWGTSSDFDHMFGWILQCTKPEQFFSSRFLHVLLLRLAFSFAFELNTPNKDTEGLAIHRKCSLWKNGIFWGTHFGMDTLVEITDNKSIVVMARFKSSEIAKCLNHRSQVLQTILECVEEFCPRNSTVESFIDTTSNLAIEYPYQFKPERILCCVKDLAEALVVNIENPSVVLSQSGKSVSAQSFFSFEPYAEIESSLLKALWDTSNYERAISDAFLSRLIQKISNNLCFLVKLFKEEAHISCNKDDLYRELLNWRDGQSISEPKTYEQLRKVFDQHSVFAGRNILVLAEVQVSSINDIDHPELISGDVSVLSEESPVIPLPLHLQGKAPSLKELFLMKYADGKEVRIMETVVLIWPKIAGILGFSQIKIKGIEMNHRFKEDAAIEMFTQWLEGGDGLKPATWRTVIQSLHDVNLTETVMLLSNLDEAKAHERESRFKSESDSESGLFLPPNLKEIIMLELSDGRKLSIWESVIPVWKYITITLGFSGSDIRRLEVDCQHKPSEACLEMFRQWLKGAHSELKPATWSTLIQSLKDVKLTEAAETLKNLKTKCDDSNIQTPIESNPVRPYDHLSETLHDESESNLHHKTSKDYQQYNTTKESKEQFVLEVESNKCFLPTLDIRAMELIEGHGGKKVKVVEGVGAHWKDLAMELEIQEEIIDQIKEDLPSHSHQEACRAVLARWLEGDGGEVSWSNLTQGLITAGLPELADDLRETLKM